MRENVETEEMQTNENEQGNQTDSGVIDHFVEGIMVGTFPAIAG